MDQVCVNGVWSWKNTEGCELEIEVDDGKREKIVSLPMSEEKKFLGVFDSPEGGNKKQLEKITDKFDMWIHRMRNGHLPPHLGWMSYRFKLWSSVRYGIGAMTNDLEEVEEFLSKRERLILNILGVASTIKKGWRKLHFTFGGIGLYNFATEQLIERLNLLLQHYRSGSSLGKKKWTRLWLTYNYNLERTDVLWIWTMTSGILWCLCLG